MSDLINKFIYNQHWYFWVIVLILIIVMLWIFYGRKNYNFVGMDPLLPESKVTPYLDQITIKQLLHSVDSDKNKDKNIKFETHNNILDNITNNIKNKDKNVIVDPNVGDATIKQRSSEGANILDNNKNILDKIKQSNTKDDKSVVTKPDPIKTQLKYIPFKKGVTRSKNNMSKSDTVISDKNDTTPTLTNNDSVNNRIKNKDDEQKAPTGGGRKSWKSRREKLCCQILEDIYGKPFVTVRPDFLKNPETGHNLEIDCYNDEIKLGIEFNGQQHYHYPNYTGQTYQEFIQQIRRDQFKVEMCDRLGVYLITVPYTVPENMLKPYIEYYLPHNVQKRLEQEQQN